MGSPGMRVRIGTLLYATLIFALAVPEVRGAPMPCPNCAKIANELDAARRQQGQLEQTLDRIRNDLAANEKSRTDAETRRGQIDADIERQRDTFVSTDTSGATLRSQYDLATGERVTTRTPPGGPSTEVGREPSKWLQDLLAEKNALGDKLRDLAAARKALEDAQSSAGADLAAAKQRVAELQKLLDECLKKHCGPQAQSGASQSLALVVERGEVMELRVPAGGDAHAITESMPGAVLYPIPSGAGGGFQVAVPVPSDPAAAAALKAQLEDLAQRGLITDLQVTPCRKYLPEATAPAPGTGGTTVRTARTAQIIKGTARTGTGLELGQAVVILVPPPVVAGPGQPPPADDDDDETEAPKPGSGIDTPMGWIPGVDDQPPAIGIPDPNGDFIIVVPEGYTGPYTIILAPICNCTTTTQTHDGTTETVPVGNETVTTPPEPTPATSAPPEEEKPEPCLCGPDITGLVTEAINRAQQRVNELPSNEVGVYDGVEFLYNNADAFDAPVAPITDPTIPPATLADAKGNWLCPSGICAQMGQYPFTLAGYCLPKHMSNEILAAFVASGVGVPMMVFAAGANVKQALNYGSLEGDAPMIAYMIGYRLQSELSDLGSLTEAQTAKLVRDVLETSLFGYFQNYAAIKDEYPTLEKCDPCPYDVPARFIKDFTTKPWRLHDGTLVGGDEVDETPMSETPQETPVKPKLKPGAAPPEDCEPSGGGASTSSVPRGGCGVGAAGAGTAPADGSTASSSPPANAATRDSGATDPADEDWGGKQNGEVVDCCELLKNVLAEIEATPFGQSPRGSGIIETVKGYLCGDITFAVTKDGPALGDRPPRPVTEDATGDGDLVGPGEAMYVRTLRQSITGFSSNEIYIGIDRSARGIAAASKRPGDFYICDYEGELCVISKADLVHNLIHEGLHATLKGKYNVNGRASLEEEIDAFNAGNEAAEAMGLAPSSDRPGRGYGANSNPSYPTYTGQ